MKYLNIHRHGGDVGGESAVRSFFPDELPADYAGGWFSTGLHPWMIEEASLASNLNLVAELAPRSLAVGEIGLDRRRGPEIDLQIEVFKSQLALAAKHGKPVVIHCVRAFSELIWLAKQPGLKRTPWIIHGFNAKPMVALEMLGVGMYLSFGAVMAKNPRGAAAESLRRTPMDRIFLETDESEMRIEKIYDAAAAVKKVPVADMADAVAANFTAVFGFAPDRGNLD